jgi:hypothetical protein
MDHPIPITAVRETGTDGSPQGRQTPRRPISAPAPKAPTKTCVPEEAVSSKTARLDLRA